MLYRTSIGLDVHARSIAATAFIPETGEIVQKAFPYDAGKVAEWAKGMPQPARCVYESGPTGFDLKRKLDKAGVPCVVGAVSKMLRPSGDRVKTDRRDATFLARMLAVGNIAGVAMPTEAMEAARDLARAREDCRHDLMRARHLLSKFLLRKGIVYPGKTAWTKAHREWLGRPGFADPCERLVFGEYLESVRSPGLRRARPGRVSPVNIMDSGIPDFMRLPSPPDRTRGPSRSGRRTPAWPLPARGHRWTRGGGSGCSRTR